MTATKATDAPGVAPVSAPGETPGEAPGEALAGLRAAVDALTSLDPVALSARDEVAALLTELARLEAVACAQAEAFRRRRDWAADGARTAAAWVVAACRSRPAVAHRRVRIGRWLGEMPLTAAAFAAGQLGIDHADALVAVRTRTRATAEAYARDEALLVGWATTLRFDEFRNRLDHWALWADHDGAEDHAARQREQRRLHLSSSLDNVWFLDAVLDPIGGEIVDQALRTIERELFLADWAAARAQLGADPSAEQLAECTPTPAQRRADALVELARRALTAPADGRPPRPLFTVLVGEESFRRVCELASGRVVTPGSLAWWLDDAVLERIVYDGPDRVVAVGRHRSFRGALRRAVQVTGRRYAHPFCDTRAEHCEVDHVDPWATGGPTTQANGRLLCGYHNRQRPHSRRPPPDTS